MFQFSYNTQSATKLTDKLQPPRFFIILFSYISPPKKKIEVLYALSRLSVLSLADEKGWFEFIQQIWK